MDTLRMLLKEKKSSNIMSVTPTTVVSAAVRSMNDAKVGAAVVLDQQRLVGIFTERDIMVRVVGEGRDPERTTISEVMTASVYTATGATRVREALSVMSERRYRHLPVLDGDVVCGMISMGDVTSWMIREQAEQFDRAIGAVKQMGFSNRRG